MGMVSNHFVIASEAKQSRAASTTALDCFVPRLKAGVLAMTKEADGR